MDALKLENIAVTGRATVELKNVRGKTVEKVEGDNFISSTVLNHALRALQRSFFSIPFNNRDFYDISNFFPTHMLYTDSATAENPLTEVAVTGNVIGFSSLDGQTSTEARRGIINTAESSHNINRTRIVCDWSTDRGNGICRSIYFTLGSWMNTLIPPMHTFNATQHTISNGTLRYAFITSNNVDLFLGDGTSNTIHQIRNNMIISNTRPSQSGFFGHPNFFTVIGNNVYTLAHRNLFVTPVGGTTSTLLTSNFGNGNEVLVAIGNIIHIFPVQLTPPTSFTVNRFDVGTMQQLPALTPILPSITWRAEQTSFPLSSTVIRVGGSGGNFMDLDLTTLQVSDTGIRTEANSATLHQGNFAMITPVSKPQNFFTSPTMNASNMYSRLLLPTNITKTSANTLKITYDFEYS